MTVTAHSLAIAVIVVAGAQAARAQTPSVTCNATIAYLINGQQGSSGAWTKTAKLKCVIPGVWSDALDNAAWTIRKNGRGILAGSVTFFGIQPPGCAATWPLAGSMTNRKNFTVTATDPTGSISYCVKTIQATAAIH